MQPQTGPASIVLPESWLCDERILGLPDKAFRLHVMAMLWSAANGTNGYIPKKVLPETLALCGPAAGDA